MKQEFYEVLSICKDDLREQFKDNPKALKKIDKMNGEDMEYFARKLGNVLTEDYWTYLKIIFEDRFLRGA